MWPKDMVTLHLWPQNVFEKDHAHRLTPPTLIFQSDVAVLLSFLIAEPTTTLFAALLHKTVIAAMMASALCLVVNLRRAPWVKVEYNLLVATEFCKRPAGPPLLGVPRQELIDAGDLAVWDVGERVSQPSLGSTPLSLAVSIRVQAMAAARPPVCDPTNR
jgi:hypothetical protein